MSDDDLEYKWLLAQTKSKQKDWFGDWNNTKESFTHLKGGSSKGNNKCWRVVGCCLCAFFILFACTIGIFFAVIYKGVPDIAIASITPACTSYDECMKADSTIPFHVLYEVDNDNKIPVNVQASVNIYTKDGQNLLASGALKSTHLGGTSSTKVKSTLYFKKSNEKDFLIQHFLDPSKGQGSTELLMKAEVSIHSFISPSRDVEHIIDVTTPKTSEVQALVKALTHAGPKTVAKVEAKSAAAATTKGAPPAASLAKPGAAPPAAVTTKPGAAPPAAAATKPGAAPPAAAATKSGAPPAAAATKPGAAPAAALAKPQTAAEKAAAAKAAAAKAAAAKAAAAKAAAAKAMLEKFNVGFKKELPKVEKTIETAVAKKEAPKNKFAAAFKDAYSADTADIEAAAINAKRQAEARKAAMAKRVAAAKKQARLAKKLAEKAVKAAEKHAGEAEELVKQMKAAAAKKLAKAKAAAKGTAAHKKTDKAVKDVTKLFKQALDHAKGAVQHTLQQQIQRKSVQKAVTSSTAKAAKKAAHVAHKAEAKAKAANPALQAAQMKLALDAARKKAEKIATKSAAFASAHTKSLIENDEFAEDADVNVFPHHVDKAEVHQNTIFSHRVYAPEDRFLQQ